MSEDRNYVSNSQLLETLLDIKADIGGLQEGHKTIQSAIVGGSSSTQALAVRVASLELSRAKQHGALAVIGVITSALGAGIEYLITHFLKSGP